MLRFASRAVGNHASEGTVWIAGLQRANFGVHRPPGAAGFHSGSASIQTDVAKLRFSWGRTVINFPIHNQPAPDTAAEGDVKDGIEADARAVRGFTQCADIGIVIH